MPQDSPNLALPYLAPAQAQKHVTHNEALAKLDTLVQLRVEDFDATQPPAAPVAGQGHALGAGPTGAWAGQDDTLAVWDGTAWIFVTPRPGWRAWGIQPQELRIWDGAGWVLPPARTDNLDHLGVNAAGDAVNRLAVQSAAVLLSHEGSDHRLKVNKAVAGDTASLLFQTGFSGRAEMGIAGDDDWSIKVSDDGTSWTEAMRFAADTGLASGAAVQSSNGDATPGRLVKTEATRIADTTAVSLANADGTVLSGFNNDSDGPESLTGSGADGFGGIWSVKRATNRNHQIAQTLSGQLFHRNESGSGFEPWVRVFDTNNLLGTVSQDAGTPTGAVIERGSNANGEYVRFADGTQICTHVVTASASGGVAWTFSAAFHAIDAITTSVIAAASARTASHGNVSGTGVDIHCFDHSNARQPNDVSVTAIGRWY